MGLFSVFLIYLMNFALITTHRNYLCSRLSNSYGPEKYNFLALPLKRKSSLPFGFTCGGVIVAESKIGQIKFGEVLAWLFRILVIAAAAFMAYTWFQPWWIADVVVIKGTNDIILHPWGAEVVRQVRVQADPALYSMPAFFTPFTWAYFGASMLALAASLFVNWKIPLGPIKVPVATVLILLVGLSYLMTVGLAYGIGTLRAAGMDVSFTGKSEFMDPMSHRKMKMEAYLQPGYWRALYSGIVFVVLAGLRILFYRRAKGQ